MVLPEGELLQPGNIAPQQVLVSYARIINQMLSEAYQLGFADGMNRGIDQTRLDYAEKEKQAQKDKKPEPKKKKGT